MVLKLYEEQGTIMSVIVQAPTLPPSTSLFSKFVVPAVSTPEFTLLARSYRMGRLCLAKATIKSLWQATCKSGASA